MNGRNQLLPLEQREHTPGGKMFSEQAIAPKTPEVLK